MIFFDKRNKDQAQPVHAQTFVSHRYTQMDDKSTTDDEDTLNSDDDSAGVWKNRKIFRFFKLGMVSVHVYMFICMIMFVLPIVLLFDGFTSCFLAFFKETKSDSIHVDDGFNKNVEIRVCPLL